MVATGAGANEIAGFGATGAEGVFEGGDVGAAACVGSGVGVSSGDFAFFALIFNFIPFDVSSPSAGADGVDCA